MALSVRTNEFDTYLFCGLLDRVKSSQALIRPTPASSQKRDPYAMMILDVSTG